MLPEFLDIKTVYLIIHLFGVAIGAGGAYMSDVMFMSSIKDRMFTTTETKFLKLGSRMCWFGLAILFVSGVLLFSLDPAKYLASGKFLAKMTIVLIILLNGLLFHFVHMKNIIREHGHDIRTNSFKKKSIFIFISGAISFVSWTSAIILGMIKKIPYGYSAVMTWYLGFLVIGIIGALFTRYRILKN